MRKVGEISLSEIIYFENEDAKKVLDYLIDTFSMKKCVITKDNATYHVHIEFLLVDFVFDMTFTNNHVFNGRKIEEEIKNKVGFLWRYSPW